MSTIRDTKSAVVDEVRARLDSAAAAVVTEYRGLTVAQMATLRRTLRAVGGDYKVFKNTLVRRAVEGSDHASLTDLLEGPTAIAFVGGDVSAVAKALRDFAKTAPALIVKGGVLEGSVLDVRELTALADLPSRDVLLAMVAGVIAAPMRMMAGLLKALPQNFAYGLSALLDQRGGSRTEAVPAEPEAPPAEAAVAAADEAPAEGEAATEDAPAKTTSEAEATGEAAAPGAEGTAEAPVTENEAPATEDEAPGDDTPADATPEDETPAVDETPEDETPEDETLAADETPEDETPEDAAPAEG